MSTTEGIREYEVGPWLVADSERIEDRDQPYLTGIGCKGGVGAPVHLEGVGGGGVLHVNNDVEAGGDVRAVDLYHKNKVKGLEHVDEG